MHGWKEPRLTIIFVVGTHVAMAPTLRQLISGNSLIQTDGLSNYFDFAEGRVRPHNGEGHESRLTISGDLLETVTTC